MNGHSNAVEQQNAEYAEQQEQAAIDIQEYYGCIKRDKQATPKMAKEPSEKVEGQGNQMRDMRERNVFNSGTFQETPIHQDRS